MNQTNSQGRGVLSDGDIAVDLMLTVRECTTDNASTLRALSNHFCILDQNGDTVLKHAMDVNNKVAMEIISESEHFHTIKGIQNKYGDYAVFTAAVRGKIPILIFLLSKPRNCRIMPPVCKEGGAPSILHEVIMDSNHTNDTVHILHILLMDLLDDEKYSRGEAKYILSFKGNVDPYGWVDPYNLALNLGRIDIANLLRAAMIHS